MEQHTATNYNQQLIDIAVTAGRHWQSPQTGLIQYCHESLDEIEHDTIPLFENFNFILALFRFGSPDFAQEAISILKSLLPFQTAEGNFPRYVHEFPRCKDVFLSIRLLPTFYRIIPFVESEKELCGHLIHTIERIIQYALKEQESLVMPFRYRLTIAAFIKAAGQYPLLVEKFSPLLEAAERQLTELHTESISPAFKSWGDQIEISESLLALNMIYPNLSNSPWKHLWDLLPAIWHKPSLCYCGPALNEKQRGEEPEATLFDLYFGYLGGFYSYRSFMNHPYQIQGAAIYPSEDAWKDSSYPLSFHRIYGNERALTVQESGYAFTVIEMNALSNQIEKLDKTFFPFRMVWGARTKTHTFSIQAIGSKAIEYNSKSNEKEIEIYITLKALEEYTEAKSDGSKEAIKHQDLGKELGIYIDFHEGLNLALNDKTIVFKRMPPSGISFKLDDVFNLQMADVNKSLEWKITLEEGEGQFSGDLMLGNRPSQLDLKGKSRFDLNDCLILLKTEQRSSHCRLRIQLSIK